MLHEVMKRSAFMFSYQRSGDKGAKYLNTFIFPNSPSGSSDTRRKKTEIDGFLVVQPTRKEHKREAQNPEFFVWGCCY